MDKVLPILEKELSSLEIFELSQDGVFTPLDPKTLLPSKKGEDDNTELEKDEKFELVYNEEDLFLKEEPDPDIIASPVSYEPEISDEPEIELLEAELAPPPNREDKKEEEIVEEEIVEKEAVEESPEEIEEVIEEEKKVAKEEIRAEKKEELPIDKLDINLPEPPPLDIDDKIEAEETKAEKIEKETIDESSEKLEEIREEEEGEKEVEKREERLIELGNTYISDKLSKEKDNFEKQFELFFENYSLDSIIFINTDNTFLNKKDIEEVHQKLLFLIEEDFSISENTFAFLSLYYFLTYRYYECIRLIEKNIEQFNKLDIFYNILGNCFYLIGNKEKALLYFEKAIKLNTSFCTAHFALSHIYFENNDYRNALACLLEAKKDYYNNDNFTLLMGKCYENIGSIKKALVYYEQYLKNKKEITIMQKVAKLFYRRGDFNKAVYYLDRFKNIEIEDLLNIENLDYKLAVSNFFINNRKKALEHISSVIREREAIFMEEERGEEEIRRLLSLFEKAFKLNIYDIHSFELFDILTNELDISFPSFLRHSLKIEEITNIDMLLSIARFSLKKKKFKTAIHFLKKILSKDTKNKQALIEVSKAYYKHSKDKDKAYNIFLFLEEKEKTDGEIDSYLGKYYLYQEDYEKAIDSLKQSIDKEFVSFTSIFDLAKSYYKIGNEKKALKYLKKAYKLKKSPNQKEDIELLILLGKLYINNNQYKEGISILKKALEIDDNLKEAHLHIASAYKKLLEEKYKEHYYKYINS